MKTFLLPELVRDEVVRYLASRPYAEVAQGIQALQALKEAPKPPEPEVPAAPAEAR